MRFCKTYLSSVVIASCLAATFFAPVLAQEVDPSWPCVQRKVDVISLGQMWPFPLAENAEISSDGAELADLLSLRRVSIDEAKEFTATFISKNQTTHDELGYIFERILDDINRDRARIIAGISRFADGQRQRAANIERLRAEMKTLEAQATPDFDEIDAVEVQVDWEERIHKDRERSLTYVCETPVILEKRAYALAQILISFVQ